MNLPPYERQESLNTDLNSIFYSMECLNGVQEVAGSIPVTPTIKNPWNSNDSKGFVFLLI